MIINDRAEGSRPFASGLGVARPRSEPRPPPCRFPQIVLGLRVGQTAPARLSGPRHVALPRAWIVIGVITPISIHDLCSGLAGGAPGGRTLNQWVKSSPAQCCGRATCTD